MLNLQSLICPALLAQLRYALPSGSRSHAVRYKSGRLHFFAHERSCARYQRAQSMLGVGTELMTRAESAFFLRLRPSCQPASGCLRAALWTKSFYSRRQATDAVQMQLVLSRF